MAITDEESASAWFQRKGRTQEERVALAARATLRALPGLGVAETGALGELALHVLRAILSSGVAAKMPGDLVQQAALAASDLVADAATYAFKYTFPSADRTRSLAYAAHAIVQAGPRDGAHALALAAASGANSAAAYAASERDADEIGQRGLERVFDTPLWPGDGVPDFFEAGYTRLRGFWDAAPDTWGFWERWYEGMLKGEPLPWDLQQKVAVIPDGEWDKGAGRIAEVIRGIEAGYLATTAPLAEEVTFNRDTQKFQVTSIPLQNAALIEAMITRTEDCLGDALAGGNGLHDRSSEVRKLKRAHERYANDPQQIELTYTSVATSLRRQMNETRELPQSEDNLALLEAVEEGALAVRAHHPEIAENRKTIAKQKLREIGQNAVDLLEDAKPVLAAISEGTMQEDFERDIPQLINDATLPVPSGAPPLPGVDESMRIFSRAAKMQLTLQSMTDKGAEVFDSKPFKTVRLGLTVSGLLSALVSLGLWVFGVF